jgi:predicted AAA+ superfamily ATPase
MQKFFNTAGACIPSDNYVVSMKHNFKRIQELIDNKRYFILHAPRQTGKTTLMLQLMEQLNNILHYI